MIVRDATLSDAARILEIYAYLKCLQSGYFDDCVTGYEINWNGSKVKNEFDLLVTKGFSSLFIELKATQEIEQNFLHKLKSLATHFAINYKAVLVADTAMDPNSSKGVKNQGQIERGEMMDISVISSKEDIDNIDKTLAKLLQIKIPQKTAAKENNAR
jgi:hypothetical protein